MDGGLARFLHGYQRFGYTPGPLLGLALLAGLAGALGVGRARRSGLRSACFLFAVTAAALLVSSVAVSQFSWRYQIPQLVLLPPAAALAWTALRGRPPLATAAAAPTGDSSGVEPAPG
jgi:p-aminobenzoyl-glutamate transporter AbgT